MNLHLVSNAPVETQTQISDKENGQSLVEIVLILAFSGFMFLGIIDTIRYIYAYSIVASVAQEGARAGIVDVNAIRAKIDDRMFGLDVANTSVVSSSDGEMVEVTVVYEFEFMLPFLQYDDALFELTSTASMVSH